MKLFDSFSRKVKTVDLSKPVGIYVCGITPYDTTHLGHAFTFITYDVIVRYLRFLKTKVTYVQNVTDIDDDLLIRAKSLKVNWKKLGQVETRNYLKVVRNLNMLEFDVFPKATDHVNEMIKIIKVLLSKNLAYEKKGSVYFEVKKDKKFGKLSKLSYRAQLEIANERGNFPNDPNKRDPLDFVLWQKSRAAEPSWNSPWCKGRPGWHIECSAMSLKHLGPTITIHGGGDDLIFPHHDAEIVQSENYTGVKFVKNWVHSAMVYCDNKKMSKSLGNMIFVSDLLKKYSPNTIRLYLLSHHYRRCWNYEDKGLEKAKKLATILEKTARKTKITSVDTKKLLPDFFQALDDDLNTPRAIKVLSHLTRSKSPKAGELVTSCGQILGLIL